MSDKEKISLLKSLQTNLEEEGCWTAEWLSEQNITLPKCGEEEEEEERQLAETHKKLTDTIAELEKQEKEKEALDREYQELSAKLKEIRQNIAEGEKELQEEKKTVTPSTTTPLDLNELKNELQSNLTQILETLSGKIEHENHELTRILDKVEDKLMRKEADLQGFQEDSYLKATAPFLKQFIHLGDMMRKVVEENPTDTETSAPYLLKQFEQLIDSIDFILRDFSVEVFRHDEEDTRFDPHTQQSFDYLTDDITLDKKIRRTINPGYIWTLPYILRAKANGEAHPLKEYRMIFRCEQVECYKYMDKKQ